MSKMFELAAIPAIPPGTLANVSRRFVLKGFAATGTLVVGTSFAPHRALAGWLTGADKMPHGTVADPHVFISIDPSGLVTIITNRSEMGQGSRTSLPMIVADEMGANWSRVRVVQAPGDEPKYGNQDTDGSRSLRHHIQPMRQCGAAVRQMLEIAAASRWTVDPRECVAQNHEIVHGASGHRLGFGELAVAASALPAPAPNHIKLKDAAQFRYIGKGRTPIVDLFDITTGRAIYGIDAKLPGMKYAVVARPPVFGGKVVSFNAEAALKVSGVEKVVTIEGTPAPAKLQPLGGVAVVARNTWAAIKGREALNPTWDDGPNGSYDSAAFKAQLEEAARRPGKVVRNDGDAEKTLASAAKVVSAEYYIPHSAHATMEPPSATVRI